MRQILVAICMVGWLAMQAANPFVGTWHGELSIGMQKLPLVIHLTEKADGLEATMDSPQQGAYGITASASCNDDLLTVEVAALQARYSGTLQEGKIAGTFVQRGFSLPLTLEPGDYVPERPQTPKAPFPYSTTEVNFTNPTDGATLSGTLTMPLMSNFRGQRKSVPVVLMVTGSGLQNRDEELFGHKPFAVIAHYLALHGIASLRYDDRGCGKSTGEVENAITETFARDASAGLQYLRSKGNTFSKVGVLGHSEGGSIAYMLAAEQKPDFIVSIAGPTIPGDKLLVAQNRALLEAMGYTPERLMDYTKGLQLVFDYIKKHPDAHEWDGLEGACSNLTNLQPTDIENYREILKQSNHWIVAFLKFDPTNCLSKMNCPAMFIFGERDLQVPPEANAAAVSNMGVIKVYPELNHLMQHARTGLPTEYPQIPETLSEEVLNDICTWVKSL